jgi:hypothetical protein
VKAVQELSKQNDLLEKRIEQLETVLEKQSTVGSKQLTAISSAWIEQNVPNPFTGSTSIRYVLPKNYKQAKMIITDNTGKTVKQVNISDSSTGAVTVSDATLSPGIYFYSLVVDGKMIATKQMILAR